MDTIKSIRRSEGLSGTQAAVMTGLSIGSWYARERNPGKFRLGELVRFGCGISPDGRARLASVLSSFFAE